MKAPLESDIITILATKQKLNTGQLGKVANTRRVLNARQYSDLNRN